MSRKFCFLAVLAAVCLFLPSQSMPQARLATKLTAKCGVGRLDATTSSGETPVRDPYEEFSPLERLLFRRFAESVATELGDGTPSAQNYGDLMKMINRMTFTRPISRVNEQGKKMLVRLFPPWLLPLYKKLIQSPFPSFSAWMNAWVTKWTTNWLMGPAQIYDLEDGAGKEHGLLIKKCRFLESTGCLRTCLQACKIPTQSFFMDEMGLPVTLKPNATDFSCRFEFGVAPLPLAQDPISKSPCLSQCQQQRSQGGQPCTPLSISG